MIYLWPGKEKEETNQHINSTQYENNAVDDYNDVDPVLLVVRFSWRFLRFLGFGGFVRSFQQPVVADGFLLTTSPLFGRSWYTE